MVTMDEISRKVHSLFKTIRNSTDHKRLSPLHKLLCLTILTSIVATVVGHWGLLVVLITCVIGLAYLTDSVLSTAWLGTPDPFACILERLEQWRETASQAYCRLFNLPQVTDTQVLRVRSESIATSNIPVLDVDLESSGVLVGSTPFQKKIRLELNSIVLLIIRDFVQFWYHSFSYNSQFLKDTRQFLLKGFHNMVDRTSRLGPHQTTAKLIHAYREHLSTFHIAKSVLEHQEKDKKSHAKNQSQVTTKLKRSEPADEALTLKFKFHPALKSKEAEKQYLRSLTKIILLCSCTQDVVNAQSAQILFIEILSFNVLLPVLELLSTPDQLYEILIKLTYNEEDGTLNEKIMKKLIADEVKRMRLTEASTSGQSQSVLPQAGLKDVEQTADACSSTGAADSIQTSGQCASGISGDDKSGFQSQTQSQQQPYKSSEVATLGSKVCGKYLTVCDSGAGVGEMVETGKALAGSPKAVTPGESLDSSSKAVTPGESLAVSSEVVTPDESLAVSVTSKVVTHGESQHGDSKVVSDGNNDTSGEGCVSESNSEEKTPVSEDKEDGQQKQVQSSDALQSKQCEMVQNDPNPDLNPVETHGDSVSEPATMTEAVTPTAGSADSGQTERNHLYGEIVATNVPLVKPKLQAFKDLFKSKKSKQQDLDPTLDKDQKSQTESNGKSFGDSILPKSLRLSPLLSRSSRQSVSGNVDSVSPTAGQVPGVACKKRSDTDGEKQTPTPSPLPTPSPSQPSKGGPLSFFKFRKPVLEFRKSSPPAEDDAKPGDASPTDTASTISEEAAMPDGQAAPPIPSVQVTDESSDDKQQRRRGSSSASSDRASSPAPPRPPMAISTYEEVSLPEVETSHREKKPRLFFGLGEMEGEVEEAEEGEEAEREDGEAGEGEIVGVPPDSSFIFQDISIPSTMTCSEFRSNAQFTLYQIEYEALHFSESGNPVLKTGVAKRRYREFVNLMSRLEENSAYKQLIKEVKGPKRWQGLPFKNMDKENVAMRQKALEQFLKSLIDVEAVCNGPEMREFLAYEGDSHIAFVKKATEINVPRIDKMLARTVSGVFDRLKSLPNLPQEVFSGIRGRDASADRKDSLDSDVDVDHIHVCTDFASDMSLDNMLRDVSEKYVCDLQTEGHPEVVPSSPTSQLLKDVHSDLAQQILQQVPRLEGDGAESPDHDQEGGGTMGGGQPRPGQLLLCDAATDLVIQLLISENHWLRHQRVLIALRNTLGRTIDRWLKESVSSLTAEEHWLYYIRLLRETLWPSGKFFSSSGEEKSEEEKEATRNVARQLLLKFFPGGVSVLVGSDSMEHMVDQLLESLQYPMLNKHFLYSAIDMLLESLFPEITDPKFQSQLIL